MDWLIAGVHIRVVGDNDESLSESDESDTSPEKRVKRLLSDSDQSEVEKRVKQRASADIIAQSNSERHKVPIDAHDSLSSVSESKLEPRSAADIPTATGCTSTTSDDAELKPSFHVSYTGTSSVNSVQPQSPSTSNASENTRQPQSPSTSNASVFVGPGPGMDSPGIAASGTTRCTSPKYDRGDSCVPAEPVVTLATAQAAIRVAAAALLNGSPLNSSLPSSVDSQPRLYSRATATPLPITDAASRASATPSPSSFEATATEKTNHSSPVLREPERATPKSHSLEWDTPKSVAHSKVL
jgi:hypothetical protein